MQLARVWAKEDPFGAEFAEITVRSQQLVARGMAIGSDPVAYRLEYDLSTSNGFLTSRLQVTSSGAGWQRSLLLERDPGSGEWSCSVEAAGEVDLPAPGGETGQLNRALDCDLGLSPLTNSMPVLRHALHRRKQTVDFLMAWIAVPELTVHPSPQRYTHVRHNVVRFESLDSDFAADITVDEHGLVVDYPGIGWAVNTPSQGQNPSV